MPDSDTSSNPKLDRLCRHGPYQCCMFEGVPVRLAKFDDRIDHSHARLESLIGQLRSANKLKKSGDDVRGSLVRIASLIRDIADDLETVGRNLT